MRGSCTPPFAAVSGSVTQIIISRHEITKAIRAFFDERGYLEVETPVRVYCPGIDPHIDAFSADDDLYLATSPELHMKRIMCCGPERIYQITRAFRREEVGRRHAPEFSMLEWYRAGTDYLGILNETEELLQALTCAVDTVCRDLVFPLERVAVDDLFHECAGWHPSRDWDEDRYYRDWVEKVEPRLAQIPALFVMDFPAALASLATLKTGNPLVCERFELFMQGMEIGNAFTELRDINEHRARFDDAGAQRRRLGKVAYPVDERFMDALISGLPGCGGIAVGVDRLIMALLGKESIDEVMAFPPLTPIAGC
ncbi:MAG: EF-P lysine aminoacylase GenX [Deltaproteobacteria bacterium]|nr:EF-P lysine aminoacylase GenX [Deltaproteobacteria bacterium]